MNLSLLALINKFLNRRKESKAQTLVEYALILVLACAIIFSLLALFGDSLRTVFTKVTATLNTASS